MKALPDPLFSFSPPPHAIDPGVAQDAMQVGARAVVIFSEKEWSDLVRLSGEWRSDD